MGAIAMHDARLYNLSVSAQANTHLSDEITLITVYGVSYVSVVVVRAR